MKAIILAAGLGTRLLPITDQVPKCMVEVNGIPIIDNQLDGLLRHGVTDVAVVSGYKADVLAAHLEARYPSVRIIPNRRYAETNNMYSLFLAKDFLLGDADGFLLMNGDVYFDHGILEGLLKGADRSLVACDRRGYLEESMKITLANGRINHISKSISEQDHYAVSIDVYRISSADGVALFAEIEDTIVNRGDERSWTEVALDRVFDKCDFRPYVIDGRWVEIDNHDDLMLAESVFAGDSRFVQ